MTCLTNVTELLLHLPADQQCGRAGSDSGVDVAPFADSPDVGQSQHNSAAVPGQPATTRCGGASALNGTITLA